MLQDLSLRENLNPPARSLRIVVVDDHGIVRDGLAALIQRDERMHVAGSARTGSEAVAMARELQPDVIIMDLMLPDISGIEATRQIRNELPQVNIIVLSACHSPDHLYRALRSGARGYVAKASASTELVEAILQVSNGTPFVSPGITDVLIDERNITSMPKSPFERLSRREIEVLRRVAQGSSSSDIGQELSLSKKTIDTYRSRLMQKLGVANRSELIRFVLENSLTPT